MSEVTDLFRELVGHLNQFKYRIIKKERTNIVRKRVGYSEYTQWDTTVSFGEITLMES